MAEDMVQGFARIQRLTQKDVPVPAAYGRVFGAIKPWKKTTYYRHREFLRDILYDDVVLSMGTDETWEELTSRGRAGKKRRVAN